MKIKYNKIALIVLSLFFIATSCNELENAKQEQYKKVVYALSYNTNNVFECIHSLSNDLDTGYISACVSGTLPTTENINVTFVGDTTQFDKYNISNFDLDSSKYAKLLDPSFYEMPSMETIIKAKDTYGLLPIYIRPEGLSPDSTYFISLKIKSASDYEINPKKQTILYRIFLENEYAQQKENTSYFMKGDRLRDGDSKATPVASTKRVFPLTGNSVRTYVGTWGHANDLNRINGYSMIITVNEDKTLKLSSYNADAVEVEQLKDSSDPTLNTYFTETDARGELQKRFKIYYRFRLKDANTGEFGAWTTMKENMKRL